MDKNFDQSIKYLFFDEGGYTNEVTDSGGPTKYGITIHDYRLYINKYGTAKDVRNLTEKQAINIYFNKYWLKMKCDKLPSGLDYAVFDYGVNSGINRSIPALQKIIGSTPDGQIGDKTLQAVSEYIDKNGVDRLITELYDERLTYLRTKPNWNVYKNGWTARCERGKKNAILMSRG